ncbi:hypothetical protein XENTR_v10005704 [Xenopus tropicalis]|nr:hypothetical protein XENTR_v10005704 [Xenopus tropicalis]
MIGVYSLLRPGDRVIDNVDPLRWGGDRQQLLKKLEMLWINTLGTLSPGGLNRKYNMKWDFGDIQHILCTLLTFCSEQAR